MKIIFLDIDGVLNSDVYDQSDYYKKATAGMSGYEVIEKAHHLQLDPDAIKLMNELVERSGAEVVLSSTWREKYTPEQMTDMLKGRGATFKISASTPILFGKLSSRIPRGKEIGEYLFKLKEWPESFVIIDDHDDMLKLKSNLVQTHVKFGLTKEIVEKALKILNGE
jgi:histidinol phosphatase-like enzyme